jgi:hypothetical protein
MICHPIWPAITIITSTGFPRNEARATLRQRWKIKVTAITVELDDNIAEVLRRLAVDQKWSETEIVREALSAYVQTARPLPASWALPDAQPLAQRAGFPPSGREETEEVRFGYTGVMALLHVNWDQT